MKKEAENKDVFRIRQSRNCQFDLAVIMYHVHSVTRSKRLLEVYTSVPLFQEGYNCFIITGDRRGLTVIKRTQVSTHRRPQHDMQGDGIIRREIKKWARKNDFKAFINPRVGFWERLFGSRDKIWVIDQRERFKPLEK